MPRKQKTGTLSDKMLSDYLPYMKTLFTLLVLFSVTLGWQQVQAQSGRSYEEWLQSSTGKKAAAKPARTASSTSRATKATSKTTAPAAKAEESAAAPAEAMAAPMGTFTGTLPCSDCQGISTELVLNASGSNRTFNMKQVYQGRPADKSMVTSSGKWFLAKGNKQNSDAVILQLIPTAGNIDPMYFLQVSEAEVKLLDRTQAEIQSKQNHSLLKH